MKRFALAALTLNTMFGAAAEESVQVFGTVDLYLGAAKSGSQPTVKKMEDGGQTASKLAFRGAEDLGDGWNAHFWFEGGISPDTGSGNLPGPQFAFTRQSFVGIAGPYGSIDMGRQYTPMFIAVFRASPLGVNQVFSTLNLVGATDAQPNMGVFAARESNSIRYRTPSEKPWFVDASVAAGEGTLPRVLGLAGGYVSEAAYVGLGYQSSLLNGFRSTWTGVSGYYDFQFAKFGAHYIRGSVNVGSTPAATSLTGSVCVPIGLSQLILEMTQRKVSGSPRGQFAATLGYDYFLSKRTALYARYLSLDNKDKSSVSLAQIPIIANSGDDQRELAMGVRHNF